MTPRTLLLLTFVALACCARPETAPTPAPDAPRPAASLSASPTPATPVAEVPTKAQPGERIPAFRGDVRRGAASEAFDSRADKAPTVYVVENPTCPACQTYAPRLVELEKTYSAKGVDFVHVYPNLAPTDAAHIAWHAKKGFVGGQLLDTDDAITKALVADRTPTIVVADAKGVVVYRGAVDDSADLAAVKKRYLADALDATLAGRAVPITTTPPVG